MERTYLGNTNPNRRRALGQHILRSSAVARDLVQRAGVRPTDTVLEIGTGTGEVTRLIAPCVSNVLTFEVDRELFDIARKNLAMFQNVDLILADPFRADTLVSPFDVCISSLPYSRSRRFVEWISVRARMFRTASVIVQEEFARKLIAKPGDKNYRAVTVAAQIAFEIQLLDMVGPDSFDPPPRVVSTIVRMTPYKGRAEAFLNSSGLKNLRYLFSYRGRILRVALKRANMLDKVRRIVESPDLISLRVEELSPQDFSKILKAMEEMSK